MWGVGNGEWGMWEREPWHLVLSFPSPLYCLPSPLFKTKENYEAHSHSIFRSLFYLDGFVFRQRPGNQDHRKQREEADRRDRRRPAFHFLRLLGRSEEAERSERLAADGHVDLLLLFV